MSFINEHSFRCLLGPQSKNVEIVDNVFYWEVGKKKHFTTGKTLNNNDIEYLKSKQELNFHYLELDHINELKKHFKVSKSKNRSIIINLENFSLSGASMKNVRHTLNKCSKNNFEILDNFKDINNIKDLINEWSNLYTDKYFRDFSGKNLYFYKNNFHIDCINAFVYHNDCLVGFGTLSPGVNKQSSYIIGKALYKRFYGLSEYIDVYLYKKAIGLGIEKVNLGQASKGLLFYKTKFPHLEQDHYDGSIKV